MSRYLDLETDGPAVGLDELISAVKVLCDKAEVQYLGDMPQELTFEVGVLVGAYAKFAKASGFKQVSEAEFRQHYPQIDPTAD